MRPRWLMIEILILMFLTFSLSPAQIPKIEKQDYLTARGMFDDGMYELALQQLINFSEKYPGSALGEEVHFLQAECYFYLG